MNNEKIITLWHQGYTEHQIATKLNISHSYVMRTISEWFSTSDDLEGDLFFGLR